MSQEQPLTQPKGTSQAHAYFPNTREGPRPGGRYTAWKVAFTPAGGTGLLPGHQLLLVKILSVSRDRRELGPWPLHCHLGELLLGQVQGLAHGGDAVLLGALVWAQAGAQDGVVRHVEKADQGMPALVVEPHLQAETGSVRRPVRTTAV